MKNRLFWSIILIIDIDDQGLRSHKHIDTYVGNLGDSYSTTNMNEGSEMCLLWTNNKQKSEYFQN